MVERRDRDSPGSADHHTRRRRAVVTYDPDEPLVNPCPECGDFDCVYWVEVDHIAECRSCGATLEEVFYVGGLYDSPVSPPPGERAAP
jgi:hypothetical protein